MRVESQSQSSSSPEPRLDNERIVDVRGGTLQALTQAVVDALGAYLGVDGRAADAALVEPMSGVGPTLDVMLAALAGDLLARVEDAASEVAAVEVSQVMATEDGYRAWGYLWLREQGEARRALTLTGPPRVVAEPSGELRVTLTLTLDEASPDPGRIAR